MNEKKHVSLKYFICLFLFLLISVCGAQSTEYKSVSDPTQFRVDSVLSQITSESPDSLKLRCYSVVSSISNNPDTVLKYSQLTLELCETTNSHCIVDAYDGMSWAYYLKDEARLSLQYALKALEVAEKLDVPDKVAEECISIAKTYHELNIRDSIFHYFNRALDIYVALDDSAYISYTYRSIGMVNNDLDFKQAATEYLQKAFVIDSMLGDYLDVADDYLYLAMATADEEQQLGYLKMSVSLFDSIPADDPYYIRERYSANQKLSRAYIVLAKKTGRHDYADSCYLYLQKIGIGEDSPSEYDWNILGHFCYAEYLSFCGKNKAALDVLIKCGNYLNYSEINATILADYYKRLTEVYTALGDYKNALASFKQMHEYKTAYANDSTLNVLASFQTEQAVKIHEVEKRQLESETRRLKTVRTSLLIGLILVVALVLLVFRMLIIKRKANRELSYKNDILDQQNAEILAQRDEIETQRDVITQQWHEVEDANRKLLESINYARRIQRAAISSETEIKRIFLIILFSIIHAIL